MSGWNFADAWETVARSIPGAPCLIQGDRRLTWSDFERRANCLASYLLGRGVKQQDKVAQYLYNCPEYLESVFASLKAGLVPINTNYRYMDDELVYLWDNADCVAVVFHNSFAPVIERIRLRVPRIVTWLWVEDPHDTAGELAAECPSWAVSYEAAILEGQAETLACRWERGGDDLVMLYTGGTTGMPKGVMWRQDDLFRNLLEHVVPEVRQGSPRYELLDRSEKRPGMVGLPACPLMHGTGWFSQMLLLTLGGSSVALLGKSLDIREVLSTIERERVSNLVIAGDAFAKPILRALDASPGEWDISSLRLVSSSGMMFSSSSKKRLLTYNPSIRIVDTFSSSEALGMAQSVTDAEGKTETAKFVLGENALVIGENGELVSPGSGEIGRVAVGGRQPVGYYKDPAKTAATFITFEGRRYSCPGDFARVERDGSLTFLGRGSICINTGGEKVFPEEVEEVLKCHPSVADAVVVGIRDEKFGEAITAVVQRVPSEALDEAELILHVKARLAGYKVPKHVIFVESTGRAANGKLDYTRTTAFAEQYLEGKLDSPGE